MLCFCFYDLQKFVIDLCFKDIFIIYARQLVISRRRVHLDIFKRGIRRDGGIRTVPCIWQHLPQEIKDFAVCGTGVKKIRKAQSGGNRFCPFCLSRTSISTQHIVAHWLSGTGSKFGVFTYGDNFRRNDIPIRELWNKFLF